MLTRRQFSLAAAAIALGPIGPRWATAAADPQTSSTTSQRDRFTALIGDAFSVYGGSGLVVVTHMTLTDVEDVGSNETVEQFTVVFEAEPGSAALDSGTYTVEHATLGRQQLMLEPVSSRPDTYTALFSLLRAE